MEIDKETGRVIMHNWSVYPKRNEGYMRTPKEVAERAVVLHLMLGVIFYHKPEEIVQWAIEEQLWEAITPDEKKSSPFRSLMNSPQKKFTGNFVDYKAIGLLGESRGFSHYYGA